MLDTQSHFFTLIFGGAISLFFLFSAFKGKFKDKKNSFHVNYADISFLIFLVFFHLSLFVSKSPFGFLEWAQWLCAFLVFICVSRISDTKKATKFFLNFLVFLGFLFAAYAFFEFSFASMDRLDSFFGGDESYRTYPNAFANLMLATLPANVLFLYKFSQEKKSSYFMLFAALILAFSLTAFLLTFSRAALLVLIFCVSCFFIKRPMQKFFEAGSKTALIRDSSCFFLFITPSKTLLQRSSCRTHRFCSGLIKIYKLNKAFLAWFFLAIFISCAAFFVLQNVFADVFLSASERFVNPDISSQQSMDERFVFWAQSLRIIFDYPLLGIGPGSFEWIAPAYQNELLVNAPHPHNFFLKIAVENGLFAFFSMIVFLGFIFWEAFKNVLKKDEIFPETLCLFFIILAFLAHNSLDYNLNFTILNVIFFVALGLQFSSKRNSSKSDFKLPRIFIIFPFAIYFFASLIAGLHVLELYFLKSDSGRIFWPHNPFKRDAYSAYEQAYESGHDSAKAKELLLRFRSEYPDFPPAAAAVLRIADEERSSYKTHGFCRGLEEYLDQATKLLEMDFYNELEYHLFYLRALKAAGETARLQEISDFYAVFLRDYADKLSVNMHQTVISRNPLAAADLYVFWIEFLGNPEVFESDYADFMRVWREEKIKFQDMFPDAVFPEESFSSKTP